MRSMFRRMGLVRPWLPQAYPWFFFIYFATVIYHLWCAWNGLHDPASFHVDALRMVNEVAGAQWWAIASLVIGLGLYVNLHLPDFKYARRFLMLGLVWTAFRFALLALGWVEGEEVANSLPNLFLCMACHASQLGEPPTNPASARS